MKIYLLRHGQTKWNIEGKIQGKTDVLLNEDGMEQAGFLAKAMEHCEARALFSSPLLRAKQTAEIVAGKMGLPVTVLPELKEVDFGLWEGCTWKEIEEKYPDDYRRWEMNPAAAAPTGGESRLSCRARSRSAGERVLRDTEGGNAVIVAHGGILVYLIDYLLRNQKEKREIIVRNASITVIDYEKDTGLGTLLELNRTSHLPAIRSGKTNKYC